MMKQFCNTIIQIRDFLYIQGDSYVLVLMVDGTNGLAKCDNVFFIPENSSTFFDKDQKL